MYGFEHNHFSLWWIFPMVMMLVCIFMMLGRKRGWGCCFYPRTGDRSQSENHASAGDILDMRFASGEIDQEEYEAKKSKIYGPGSSRQADSGENDAGLPRRKE